MSNTRGVWWSTTHRPVPDGEAFMLAMLEGFKKALGWRRAPGGRPGSRITIRAFRIAGPPASAPGIERRTTTQRVAADVRASAMRGDPA